MRKWSQITTIEKASIVVALFILFSLLIAVPFSVYEKNWMALFVSVTALFLFFVSNFFARRYDINLTAEFQLIVIVFIYAGLFLGEARGYYTRFWWWDSVLHAFSGVALGFSGFLLLYVLYKTKKLKTGLKFIAFFSFCFAVALGALWEVFEFSIDSFFGANMQKARALGGDTRMGVLDTMWDLILNTTGAAVASLAGYFYLKKWEIPVINTLVEKFEKKNPRLFKK